MAWVLIFKIFLSVIYQDVPTLISVSILFSIVFFGSLISIPFK